MAQVVQELVAQPFALVRARNEPGDVEELDRYRSSAVDASAVIWSAAVRDVVACACAVDLEVSDCSLGVDGCETARLA